MLQQIKPKTFKLWKPTQANPTLKEQLENKKLQGK